MGLLSVPDSHAYRVLQNLDIDLEYLHKWASPKHFPSMLDEITRLGKWTEDARQVVSLSQEEARRLQHNWVGVEHLLLGLLNQGGGVAARVLTNAGLALSQIRQILESLRGRGDYAVLSEIELTSRAKKAMHHAADEAEFLKYSAVNTGHLLLSLVHEEGGLVAGILEYLNMNREDIRAETLRLLSNEAMGTVER